LSLANFTSERSGNPRLQVLINHGNVLDRELRNQYANLLSLERCLDMYAYWVNPGAPKS
jgi:hypothetical protein